MIKEIKTFVFNLFSFILFGVFMGLLINDVEIGVVGFGFLGVFMSCIIVCCKYDKEMEK